MLTTKYVRDNLPAIKRSMAKRKSDYPVDTLIKLDEQWRSMQTELQALRAKINKASLEISSAKKGGADKAELDAKIGELSGIKKKIGEIEAELPSYESRIEQLLWNMPNTLHDSVPYGIDDSENKEIKSWGEAKTVAQKSHEDLLVDLGLLDLKNAARVSGSRFYYLLGDMVLLEQSLVRFAVDELVKKKYVPVSPPLMMKKKLYRGVTALGDFEEALYAVADTKESLSNKKLEKMEEELFLIATSEHVTAAMHSDTVFSQKELPLKYVAISPCFRREAGSHGKDTKGIFRVHQFNKVEQFIFCRPEDSPKLFEELVSNGEGIYQKLKLPYRITDICTGDIGTVAAVKKDIDGFLPGQGKYRELGSYSNCTDWQSLRLDIKYEGAGERSYVHTLNGTATATTRTLVAIVENYANGDGSITVPDVLVPYMGKERIGRRS
jgi:seryl-tRNA synthetase